MRLSGLIDVESVAQTIAIVHVDGEFSHVKTFSKDDNVDEYVKWLILAFKQKQSDMVCYNDSDEIHGKWRTITLSSATESIEITLIEDELGAKDIRDYAWEIDYMKSQLPKTWTIEDEDVTDDIMAFCEEHSIEVVDDRTIWFTGEEKDLKELHDTFFDYADFCPFIYIEGYEEIDL